MCVCETNLKVTDHRNICAVDKRKTSKSRDVLQWCCICTIKDGWTNIHNEGRSDWALDQIVDGQFLWKSVSPIPHAKNFRWNWSWDVKNVGFHEYVYLIIRGWPFLTATCISQPTYKVWLVIFDPSLIEDTTKPHRLLSQFLSIISTDFGVNMSHLEICSTQITTLFILVQEIIPDKPCTAQSQLLHGSSS